MAHTLTVVFLLAGAIWFLYWFLEGRFYINTEDAYVTGNQVMLTPQVAAGVKAIYADETDLVEQGQLVVELDPSNYQIRVEDLKQSLADTVREVAVLFQQVHARAAEVTLREAQYRQAKLDYQHGFPLVKTGVLSQWKNLKPMKRVSMFRQPKLNLLNESWKRPRL